MTTDSGIGRRPASRLQCDAGGDESGFLVAEFIIAMTLLVIVIMASAQLMSSGITVSGNTRMRVIAANVATATLERARGTATNPLSFHILTDDPAVVEPGGGRGQYGTPAPTTQTIGGLTVSVSQTVQWENQRGTGSDCDANVAQPFILRVTAAVSWLAMHGAAPVTSTTALVPPVGSFSTSTGSLAVKVEDSNGALASGVTVTATDQTLGGVQSFDTGADGCAFFASLAPDPYKVTIAKALWVDGQGNPSPPANTAPSSSVTVTAGLINKTPVFFLDNGANITTTLLATTLPATGLPLSVGNTQLTPQFMKAYAPGTSVLGAVFPYPSGYHVFAGACTDADPLGATSGVPFYSPATATVVATPPGGAVAATVPLYPLAVKVTGSGVALVGATIVATETGGSIPACAAGITTTYGLTPTAAGGTSLTGVTLGHLKLVATYLGVSTGTPVYVWSEPDGIHTLDSSGNNPSASPVATPIPLTVP